MSIHINKLKCIGCGKCADICPGNLLVVKGKKADIRDARDCWSCMSCIKICPKNAIYYQLAADLGGAGAKLSAVDEKNTLTWVIENSGASVKKIVIDKGKSNQY